MILPVQNIHNKTCKESKVKTTFVVVLFVIRERNSVVVPYISLIPSSFIQFLPASPRTT